MGVSGCGSCSGRSYVPTAAPRAVRRAPRPVATEAVSAAVATKFEVLSPRGTVYKSFTSRIAAERYATVIRGTVRPVK